MVPEIDHIDWSRAWYAAVAESGSALRGDVDLHTQLNRLLTSAERPRVASRKAILFVPGNDAPLDISYETHIHSTGRIPTRTNLHDTFNALSWLAFPKLKAQLNAMQAHAIARDGVGPTRGRLRDVATLLDENGVLLACSSETVAVRLRRFDWRALFVEHRAELTDHAEPWIAGHALMEKLHRPYKAITGHTLIVPVESSYFGLAKDARMQMVDDMAAAWLAAMPLAAADLSPLPVLGVPGWWPGNAQSDFYDDAEVFRPGRRPRED
jgi:hypothetical protein